MEAFQNQVNVHLLSNQPDSAGGKAVTPERMTAVHKTIRAGQPLELASKTATTIEQAEAPMSEPVNSKLIECADCGKEISMRAASCPHCGAPVEDSTAETASGDDEYGYGDDEYDYGDSDEYDYGDSNDIDLSDEFHDAPTGRIKKRRRDTFESESLGVRLRVTKNKLEIGKQILAVDDIESITVEDISSQVRSTLWLLCLAYLLISGVTGVLVVAMNNEAMASIGLLPVSLLWIVVLYKQYVWWRRRHMDSELVIMHDGISRIRGTHAWCNEAYNACRRVSSKRNKSRQSTRGSIQDRNATPKLKRQGGIAVVIGIIWILVAMNADTTVGTGMGRVHNIGKMNSQRNHMILGGLILAGGVALSIAAGKKT